MDAQSIVQKESRQSVDDQLPHGGVNLPGRLTREDYLRSLAAGTIPPLVVMSGLPGAGKTTALQFLQQEGSATYTPVTRYMPRERRPSDTAGDKPWAFDNQSAPAEDSTGPKSVIFSNVKYKGYYGFPGRDIVNAIDKGEIPVMLVTSYVEMVQLSEALHNLVPGAPLVSVRLEVPQEVLPGRISRRVGADATEHQERIERLNGLVKADLLQTPLLHKVHDTRVIWNLKPSEIAEHGYFGSQIKALTPDALAAMLVEAKVEAIARAQREAQDILTPRVLTYESPVVPASLTDVLDRVLLPAAAERLAEGALGQGESPLVLKAGLAAAIYLGDKGRVVSPDIDFVLPENPGAKLQMEVLMESLSDKPVEWVDGKNKAVYHCEGIKGEAKASDGTNVELDALLTTRVQPDPKGFVFACTHDSHDLFYRRMVITPAGNAVAMIPPEQLCVEKLIAGRGPDINKFDLFDASGLLATFHLNPNLVKKMIELQRYDEALDEDAARVLADAKGQLSVEVLETLGITEPAVQDIVRSLGELVDDEWAEYPSETRCLTKSALKQFAFLSAVERSLKKVEAIMTDRVFLIAGEKVSIGERFGEDKVREGISRLRAHVRLHSDFYVGMQDTFVRRALGAEKDETRFFKHLESQRQRLSR
jgi:hypothetical protein